MVIAVKSNPVRLMMDKSATIEEPASPRKSGEENGIYCNNAPTKSARQEFVGNCKEFRIDNNKSHLKIIGNCNKIRLANNNGHLEIIGNSTRVKVAKNNGQISYTGNSGKVYLGRDSSNKNVDYIGNDGVLKVVPEENLNIANKKSSEGCEKIPLGGFKPSVKVDQSNYSPRSSVKIETGKCTSTEIHFNPSGGMSLQLNNNTSMPNVNVINLTNGSGSGSNVSNSIRIASSTGDIVVNSSYRV